MLKIHWAQNAEGLPNALIFMRRNYIKQTLLYFWVRPYGKFYFYFKRVKSRVKAKEITGNLAVKEKKRSL